MQNGGQRSDSKRLPCRQTYAWAMMSEPDWNGNSDDNQIPVRLGCSRPRTSTDLGARKGARAAGPCWEVRSCTDGDEGQNISLADDGRWLLVATLD